MFLIGLLAGVIVTAVAIVVILPGKMFIVKESKYSFEETLAELEKSATEHKWGVPHQYDLQATLKGKGYEVDKVHVFSLCKPEHAYEILGSKEQRLVSALMPCRVAVFKSDEKTYISMLNAGLFSKFMGKKVKEVMGAASKENVEILEPIVN
jgi:uncharacterized protein (DUF302 family)